MCADAAYLVKSALERYGILKPKKGTRKVEVKKRVVAAGEENEWLKGTNFNQVCLALHFVYHSHMFKFTLNMM